jgi:hypothetical protein
MRWVQKLLSRAALALALLAASAGAALADGRDRIVGRADADASGGWPVVLWVRDGERSRVTARIDRAQLGAAHRWQAAAGHALMRVERFGAPQLQGVAGYPLCPVELEWGQEPQVPPAHWPGEVHALHHAACATGRCPAAAWRAALPASANAPLPVGTLWPQLAQARPQWR